MFSYRHEGNGVGDYCYRKIRHVGLFQLLHAEYMLKCIH